MKTIKEIKNWLLENAVDHSGNLDLSYLDFSDFEGDIFINHMKVKGDLWQNFQEVEGDICQGFQATCGNLYQDCNNVRGDLYQIMQRVNGKFFNHKLEDDEYWETHPNYRFVFLKKSQ